MGLRMCTEAVDPKVSRVSSLSVLSDFLKYLLLTWWKVITDKFACSASQAE
jgi:hypothetical protein